MNEHNSPGPWPETAALLREAWARFAGRFWLLLSVAGAGGALSLLAALLPMLAAGAAQLLRPGLPVLPLWAGATLLGLSASLWIAGWAQVAACEAVMAEQPDFWSCYRRTWGRIAGFSWVCLLYFVVVLGGLFLFILPGLYLGVALIFAPLAHLEEGLGPWASLERSLDYARGRWLGLSLRVGLLGALAALPSLVPFFGFVLGALLSPLPLVALVLLYRSAKESPSSHPTGWAARAGLALAAAGIAAPIAATVRIIPAARALLPVLVRQKEALASMDPAQAQRLLQAIQEGKSTTETAVLAAQILQAARGAAPESSVSTGTAVSPEGAP